MAPSLSALFFLHLTIFPQQEKIARSLLSAAVGAASWKKGCKQAAPILPCQVLLPGGHSVVLEREREGKISKRTRSTAEPSTTDLLQETKIRHKAAWMRQHTRLPSHSIYLAEKNQTALLIWSCLGQYTWWYQM